jgi:hypothetical protein
MGKTKNYIWDNNHNSNWECEVQDVCVIHYKFPYVTFMR